MSRRKECTAALKGVKIINIGEEANRYVSEENKQDVCYY